MISPPSSRILASADSSCHKGAAGRHLRAALCGLLLTITASASDAPHDLTPEALHALRSQLAATLTATDPERDRFDAEVWLHNADAALSHFLSDTGERLKLLELVWHEANRHRIDPEFALAIMEVESTFDRFAVSTAGAQGLMQVMPFWKFELGRAEDNLTAPDTNLRYGMTIFAHYLQLERGDAVRALTRYHGNRNDLSYPERIYRTWNRRWRTTAPDEVRKLIAACYKARLHSCTRE